MIEVPVVKGEGETIKNPATFVDDHVRDRVRAKVASDEDITVLQVLRPHTQEIILNRHRLLAPRSSWKTNLKPKWM